MPLAIEMLDRSCALASVLGEPKGTAYLVAANIAVTCEHVVSNAAAEEIQLKFVRGPEAEVHAVEVYSDDDITVLVLSKPLDVPWFRFAPGCHEQSPWRTFGFPQRAQFEGRPFYGTIAHPSVRKKDQERILLWSQELAAGLGTPVHGLSGAPIVVGDRVVGMASEVSLDDPGLAPEVMVAAWGHVFAIPAAKILGRLASRVRAAGSGLPRPDEKMRLAARVGLAKVREALGQLEQAGVGDPGATLAGAEALIALGEPGAALKVLEHCQESDRRQQLYALTLAKLGRKDDAIEILERLFAQGIVDAETGGILGGRYKERWLAQPDNRALLDRCYEIYAKAYEVSGDPYPGINVAAVALYRGERLVAHKVATEVLAKLDEEPPEDIDHWRLATRAEALLLTGDLAGAATAYRQAVAREPTFRQDHCVMRRQARRNLKYLPMLGDDKALDEVFPRYGVIVFWGPLTDLPGTAPRRPNSAMPAVRERLRAYLAECRATYGFCAAARGSDLVFVDEMATQRNGQVKVFLPLPREEFKRTVVGQEWQDTFERLEQSRNVTIVDPDPTSATDGRKAWTRCYQRMREAAARQGDLVDEIPVALTTWDGSPDPERFIDEAVADWQLNTLGTPKVLS